MGSTCAYALLIQGVAREIVLIDVNHQRAQGEAMDLEQGLQFLPSASVKFSSDYQDCHDAAIVVIAAGANQKPGETRLDLIRKNSAIFKDIIPKIARASPHAVLLVVTNPVDVLTFLALTYSGFRASQVIGSGTTLDSARLRFMLGKHYGIHPSSVHAHILGEHGDTSFPLWSNATIAGVAIKDFPGYDKRQLDELYERTRKAAYEIISRKGATYYAIGITVSNLCSAILRDEHKVYPVSVLLKNYSGESGVCLSVPCVLGREGVVKQIHIKLNPSEKTAFKKSVRVLKAALKGANS